MKNKIKVVLVQMNSKLGDIKQNFDKIKRQIEKFKKKKPNIIVFPELSLIGFCPDLLNYHPYPDFYKTCCFYMSKICKLSNKDTIVVVGHFFKVRNKFYNVLSCFQSKKLLTRFLKDDFQSNNSKKNINHFYKRYESILIINGYRISFLIGEDIFSREKIYNEKKKKIDLLFLICSFPYSFRKNRVSDNFLKKMSTEMKIRIVYLNSVGGQDELIFEGNSRYFDQVGRSFCLIPYFLEKSCFFTIDRNSISFKEQFSHHRSKISRLYDALVLSTRDYVNKNHFLGIVIGLSGGIDSALSLSIAIDAIGKESVKAIMMPSINTSQESIEDAKKQCELVGTTLEVISIQKIFEQFSCQLKKMFKSLKCVVLENLQARCRAVFLMGISNQNRYLLLSTSNRSELYTGYTTIYGDMSGGFAPLKDIPKTIVFSLSKYRNTINKVIPENIILKKPTSELRKKGFDEDDLPKYSLLDEILFYYIDKKYSIQKILSKIPLKNESILEVIKLFHSNEFKRKQSPIGPILFSNKTTFEKTYPVNHTSFLSSFLK
ncbi:NAD+ synthase [Candidatus Riesia pediculicola]|uniref:NAD+ synthase n=1 Tax=Candidatus Riesia pediculicola TaxID=401619 RepID=UPI0009B71CD5|nr:NAD+ synthase [Candidatus Riesia pediculicola]ARC53815.1 hypothetical protein AOE55_01460 [Candidatus Riesia pediculicola]